MFRDGRSAVATSAQTVEIETERTQRSSELAPSLYHGLRHGGSHRAFGQAVEQLASGSLQPLGTVAVVESVEAARPGKMRSGWAARQYLCAGLILVAMVWPIFRACYDAIGDSRSAALATAIANDNAAEVQRLVHAGADPNARLVSKHSNTLWKRVANPLSGRMPALCVAAGRGDYGIVKELLDHGADVNIRAEDGSTPIVYAAGTAKRDPRYVQTIELLVAHGALVNMRTTSGETALSRACANSNTLTASVLRKFGAD